MLRAYARYLRQAGIAYSQDYIATTLDKYPGVAAAIFRLFHDTLDTRLAEKARVKKLAELHQAIEAELADVPSLDDDRILRRYVNIVDATLRTNYFQKNPDGSPKADAGLQARSASGRRAAGSRSPSARSSSMASRSKACICASARWRAAACAGRIAPRITAPRCSASSRRSRSRTPSSCRSAPRVASIRRSSPIGGSRDEIFNAGREAYKTYIRTLLSITDNHIRRRYRAAEGYGQARR